MAISAFVALTLTPMLATHIIRTREEHTWFYRKTEPFFAALLEGYKRSLDGFMRHRWVAFVIIAAATAVVFWLGATLPQELAPLEDRSRLRMTSTAPEGTSFERMDRYMDSIIDIVRTEVPEADNVLANTSGFSGGANSGSATVTLVPPERGSARRVKSRTRSRDRCPP